MTETKLNEYIQGLEEECKNLNEYIQDLEEECENLSEYNRLLIERIKELELEHSNESFTDALDIEGRICSKCGKHMNEGFCLYDGLEYYCSDECLASEYTDEEYGALYVADDGYWTKWEE